MATKETAAAVEKTIDVLEEPIEAVVEAATFVRSNPALLAGVALIGFAGGAAAGYFFAKKKLRLHYEELASNEIQEARQFYSQVHKVDDDGEVLTPEQVLEQRHGKGATAAARALQNYQGMSLGAVEAPADTEADLLEETVTVTVEKDVVVEVESNVFDSDDAEPDLGGWDYETELARRNADRPYVITVEEFLIGEKNYEQESLTYFAGDDVLVDQRSQLIPDPNYTVGDDNLTRFGAGTKNNNEVHVRNEELEMDFEITRSQGTYAKEVLGFDEDLTHSESYGKSRRFRHED